jgi:hypothetical protein
MLLKTMKIILRGWILRCFFPLTLIVLAGLASPVARAETVQDQCNSLMNLTDEQKEELGIEEVEWKTSDSVINTPHCKILITSGGGEFSSTGILMDYNQNLPTAAILRVPECYNGTRVLFFRPGASFDLSQALNPVRPFLAQPSCTAAMSMWTATFVTTPEGASDDYFSPPNNFLYYPKALSQMMHLGRDILSQYFGPPQYSYYHGASHGALIGLLIAEQPDLSWIDGWVLQGGGDGQFSELVRRLWSCYQDLSNPPVSKLTDVIYIGGCTAEILANEIGPLDHGYRASILEVRSKEGEEAAVEFALAYNIEERPERIQNNAESVTLKGNPRAKTIIIHGLQDDTVAIDDTLRYFSKIIDMGNQDNVRVYLGKILPHALPPIINTTFVQRMIAWAELGNEPGDVPFNIPALGGAFTVKNCTDLGYGNDPCGCFDDVHGSTGCHEILGLPPPE